MKRTILILLMTSIISCVLAQNKPNDGSQQLAMADVSVAQLDSYDIVLFPNPVKYGILNVKSRDYISSVEIMNVIGHIIQTSENKNLTKEMTILLDDCEKGIYLVRVSFGEKNSIIKKILVK